MLRAEHLHWHTQGQHIVRDVSLHLQPGECLGLIGPNGSGKSSLLRLLYRALQPTAGHMALRGEPVQGISVRDFARQVAVLAQDSLLDPHWSVQECVMMGRIPHQPRWATESREDHAQVQCALEAVHALHLAHRAVGSLSGGERQRVLLARALAQQPSVILLDEPTNHLDIRHQFELMGLLRKTGLSTIVALHDLNLAAHYCHRLYLLESGTLTCHGSPENVLTPQRIQDAYGVRAHVGLHPHTGRVHIAFVPEDEAY